MVAAAAIDISDVEYFFTNVTNGAHNSGWQDSTTYTDTGLSAGTTYQYTVTARDKSTYQNQTAASTIKSATTEVGNRPPEFNFDVFIYPNHAAEGIDYVGDISTSTYVTDPDVGDVLTFTKEAGPAWLNVAAGGQLSGISADGDVSLNEFTVRVTDLGGLYDEATMRVYVDDMFTGELGLVDFAGFAAQWMNTSCGSCAGADLDDDGDVGISDLARFGQMWLIGP